MVNTTTLTFTILDGYHYYCPTITTMDGYNYYCPTVTSMDGYHYYCPTVITNRHGGLVAKASAS